jgi:hypothetical protein
MNAHLESLHTLPEGLRQLGTKAQRRANLLYPNTAKHGSKRDAWLQARIRHQPTADAKFGLRKTTVLVPARSDGSGGEGAEQAWSVLRRLPFVGEVYWEDLMFKSRLLVITCVYYFSQVHT